MKKEEVNTLFYNCALIILISFLATLYFGSCYAWHQLSERQKKDCIIVNTKLELAESEVKKLSNKLEILEEDLAVSRTQTKIVGLPRLILHDRSGFFWILDRSQPFNYYYNSYAYGNVYHFIFTAPMGNIKNCEIRFNPEKIIDWYSDKQAVELAFTTREENRSYNFRSFPYKGKGTHIDCPDFGKQGYYKVSIEYTLPDKSKRTDTYYIDIGGKEPISNIDLRTITWRSKIQQMFLTVFFISPFPQSS